MSVGLRTAHVGVRMRMMSLVGVTAVGGLIRVGHGEVRWSTRSSSAGSAGHVTAICRRSAVLRVLQLEKLHLDRS